MDSGIAFMGGALFGLLIFGLVSLFLRKRDVKKDFEEVEIPKKPEPRLTDEEKKRIRNEIEADNNSALARRFLELLSKRGRGK